MNLMVKMGRELVHVWTSTGRVVAFIGICFFAAVSFAAESITITARPRYPWNGKVDLRFTIDGTSGTKYDTSFTAKDLVGNTNLTLKTLYKANGTSANAAKEQLLPGTYNWVWNATADCGSGFVCERVQVEGTVKEILGGVQLWKDGPYWAECNVGATKPEEYGYYFWWGDVVGYKRNSKNNGWVSVKDSTSFSFSSGNCPTDGKKHAQLQSAGYIDATENLVAAHDAATAHLGAPWRMPTEEEIQALINNCTTKWTTRNGVSGRLVTGKGTYSSKSIFLPAAGRGDDSSCLYYLGSHGCYWSSTPTPDLSSIWMARTLNFGSGYFDRLDGNRYWGSSVRPVRGVVK